MPTFACLATHVTLTCSQQHRTSSLPGQPSVFLGYSSNHKGYRCLDLSSNRILTSRHVVFDEASFPLAGSRTSSTDLDFLSKFEVSVFPIGPSPAGAPHHTSLAPRPLRSLRPTSHPLRPLTPQAHSSWCRSYTPRHARPRLLRHRPRLVRPRHQRPRHARLRLYWCTAADLVRPLCQHRRRLLHHLPPLSQLDYYLVLSPLHRWLTSMGWLPVASPSSVSQPRTPPQSSRRFRSPIAAPSPIPIGALRWKRSMVPCSPTTRGTLFHVPSAPTSSPASGFFITSFMLTALSTDTRLVGYYVASHSALVLIMMRHETFSPVVKPATVRTVLSLALS